MSEKEQFDTLHVVWNSISSSIASVSPVSPLVLRVYGAGGTPSLQILNKSLDYGTCMLGVTTSRELILKNMGNAETLVDILHDRSTEDSFEENSSTSVKERLLLGGKKSSKYTLSFQPASPLLIKANSSKVVTVHLHPIRSTEDEEDEEDEYYDPSVLLPSIATWLNIKSTESISESFRINILSKVGRPSIHVIPRGYFQGSSTGHHGHVAFHTVVTGRTHISTFQLENRGGVEMKYEILFAKLSSKYTQAALSENENNDDDKDEYNEDDVRIEQDNTSKTTASDSTTMSTDVSKLLRLKTRTSRWLNKASQHTHTKLKQDTLTKLYFTNPELFIIQRKRQTEAQEENQEEEDQEEEDQEVPIFDCSPSHGTIEIGEKMSIHLKYTPKKNHSNDEKENKDKIIVLIQMPNLTLCGMINGCGGEPNLIFDIDNIQIPVVKQRYKKKKKKKKKQKKNDTRNNKLNQSSIIEFGTCRTGSVHNRKFVRRL